ncbi:MAG: hypothetical protein ACFFAX_16855 [Promethearchaeota archaeon]
MTSKREDLIEDNDEYIRELDELKARELIDELALRSMVVWLADVLGVEHNGIRTWN